MDSPDRLRQFVPPEFGRRRESVDPGVVAGLRDLQGVAGPGDRAAAAVLGQELERQLGGQAK
jgi:hypothetical protein